MTEKEIEIIKVLTKLGLRDEPEVPAKFVGLYPEYDNEKDFLDKVERLFNKETK